MNTTGNEVLDKNEVLDDQEQYYVSKILAMKNSDSEFFRDVVYEFYVGAGHFDKELALFERCLSSYIDNGTLFEVDEQDNEAALLLELLGFVDLYYCGVDCYSITPKLDCVFIMSLMLEDPERFYSVLEQCDLPSMTRGILEQIESGHTEFNLLEMADMLWTTPYQLMMNFYKLVADESIRMSLPKPFIVKAHLMDDKHSHAYGGLGQLELNNNSNTEGKR